MGRHSGGSRVDSLAEVVAQVGDQPGDGRVERDVCQRVAGINAAASLAMCNCVKEALGGFKQFLGVGVGVRGECGNRDREVIGVESGVGALMESWWWAASGRCGTMWPIVLVGASVTSM